MIKISLIVSSSLLLVSCALSPKHNVVADADSDYLIGTWSNTSSSGGYHELEVFLPSMAYCNYSNSAIKTADSVGTWHVAGRGIAGVDITFSTNPKNITPDGLSEIRVIKRIEPDKLLMGYSCSHCDGGIAGSIYVRHKAPKTTCNLPSQ